MSSPPPFPVGPKVDEHSCMQRYLYDIPEYVVHNGGGGWQLLLCDEEVGDMPSDASRVSMQPLNCTFYLTGVQSSSAVCSYKTYELAYRQNGGLEAHSVKSVCTGDM